MSINNMCDSYATERVWVMLDTLLTADTIAEACNIS